MKISLKPSNSSINLASQGGESNSEFHSWHDRRGSWLAYLLGVYLLQLIFLSLPFLSVATVWTLTLVTHNVVSTVFLFKYVTLLRYCSYFIGSIYLEGWLSQRRLNVGILHSLNFVEA